MKKVNSYLYSGLIICHHCGEYFRGLTERGTKKFICSGYSNRKGCIRNAINEEQITYMITIYCERKNITLELSNQFMVSIIDRIIVKDAVNFNIFYKDETHQFLTDNGVKFI